MTSLVSWRLLSRKEKRGLAFRTGGRALLVLLELVAILSLGVLAATVSSGISGAEQYQLGPFSVPVDDDMFYVFLALIVVSLFVAKSVAGIFITKSTANFLADVEARKTEYLTSSIMKSDVTDVEARDVAHSQWALVHSTHQAFASVLFASSTVVAESVLLFAVLGLLFVIDYVLASLLVLYFGIVAVAFQMTVRNRFAVSGRAIARTSSDLNDAVITMFDLYRESSVAGVIDYYLERFTTTRRAYARARAFERFALSLQRYVFDSAAVLGLFGFLVWQLMISENGIDLEVVAIFLVGSGRIAGSILPLQNAINELRVNGPQAIPAQQLMEEVGRPGLPPTIKVAETPLLAPISNARPPLLVFHNVSFRYPESDVDAVQRMSFQIPRGALGAIIGPSGSGKSTLADLALGLVGGYEGEISLGGVAPKTFRSKRVGAVAYVPQKPSIVPGTVAENICVGRPIGEKDYSGIWTVLSLAGLADTVEKLPGKLDFYLGEQASRLSGGQLQRLGIARALYFDPVFLVLDEATNTLDAETEAGIVDTLSRLRGKVTVVTIAHQLSTVREADVVLAIEAGNLIASGSFSEVRRAVSFVEKYIELNRFSGP